MYCMYCTLSNTLTVLYPPTRAGAGNQVTVVLLDVLHKLLLEDEVVLLKLNPVNE